jgi:hypothetical protein
LLGFYRPDEMADGVNSIQGVRATDPLLGTWTTPDAFQGVHKDPLSQKRYVWEGNNPIEYDDPTGYNAIAIGIGGGVAEAGCILLEPCGAVEAVVIVGGGLIIWIASEHTAGARPSTEGKHQAGQTRGNTDAGGEKADNQQGGNRRPQRKRPPDHKGSWPPTPPPTKGNGNSDDGSTNSNNSNTSNDTKASNDSSNSTASNSDDQAARDEN